MNSFANSYSRINAWCEWKSNSKPEQIIELLQAQPLSLVKTSSKLKLMHKISKIYFFSDTKKT